MKINQSSIQILKLLLVLFPISSKAQWTNVTTGTNSSITDVDLATPTLGYYHFGFPTNELMKTTDGGMTWSGTGKTFSNYNQLQCIGPDTIYAQTFFGMEYSHNAGNSWQTSTINGSYALLYSQFFPSNQIGYASGINNNSDSVLIFKTINAGQNWNLINRIEGFTVSEMYFISNNIGFLCTEGKIFKTIDGGINWVNKYNQNGVDLQRIFFADNLNGYTLGYSGDFVKTIDGGETWTLYNSVLLQDDPISTTSDLHFINKDTGYVTSIYVGNGVPAIQYTVDGGLSWGVSHPGTVNGLESITFFNETSGLAGGGQGELLYFGTSNSIFEWMNQEIFITENENFIVFNFEINSFNNIRLFDISGKEILNTTTSSSSFSLEKNRFEKGIYILNVMNEKGMKSKKFVIK